MSIELSAVCPEAPTVTVVSRLTEALLGLALDADAPVVVATSTTGSVLTFGSAARTFVTIALPGEHEFADAYVLTADDRERTPESRLLSIVVVLASAILAGGRVLDEQGQLRTTDLRELSSAILKPPTRRAEQVLGELVGR